MISVRLIMGYKVTFRSSNFASLQIKQWKCCSSTISYAAAEYRCLLLLLFCQKDGPKIPALQTRAFCIASFSDCYKYTCDRTPLWNPVQ